MGELLAYLLFSVVGGRAFYGGLECLLKSKTLELWPGKRVQGPTAIVLGVVATVVGGLLIIAVLLTVIRRGP
jgi:hypothetical protein